MNTSGNQRNLGKKKNRGKRSNILYRRIEADATVQGHGEKGHEQLEGVEVAVVLPLI